MRKGGIVRRWFFSNVLVVLSVFVVLELLIAVFLRNYYYSSTNQLISTQMNILTSALSHAPQGNSNDFDEEVRKLVETFGQKDKIELMAVNRNGEIVITSSGFETPEDMNMSDYDEARKSNTNSAYSTFKLPNGESVLAFSVIFYNQTGEFEGLRMITSLEKINRQIIAMMIVITIVFVVILLIVYVSGLYFVRSIVSPIRRINYCTRQYAKGLFSKKIEYDKEDEIGELCKSVNYMAAELSNSETLKNEFISSVSHELRTPLTAIKGWSETLREYHDDEILEKGMKVIIGETERLSNMVEELLDFSRVQSGKFKLEKERMDLLAELGEAVLMYTPRAKDLGIELKYYGPENLPFIYGDKNRIRQIFINIIDNAIKYSNPGGVVSVEAYSEKDDIVVLVSDTGVGIPKEDLEKVRMKFYKANKTRPGSGIGLAVVDELVNLHNGTLTLNSEEGVGTTVMITLPIERKERNTNE